MSESRTKQASRVPRSCSEPLPPEEKLILPAVLLDARRSLHELVLTKGLEVFASMLEEDRTALCGAKNRPQMDRAAYRYGHDEGQQVLGGRKIRLRKPRVRGVNGGELELPSWREMNQEDPLSERVVEQMLVGVSTRNYGRSLEPLPAAVWWRWASTRRATSTCWE